jgi:hypothetical protein
MFLHPLLQTVNGVFRSHHEAGNGSLETILSWVLVVDISKVIVSGPVMKEKDTCDTMLISSGNTDSTVHSRFVFPNNQRKSPRHPFPPFLRKYTYKFFFPPCSQITNHEREKSSMMYGIHDKRISSFRN